MPRTAVIVLNLAALLLEDRRFFRVSIIALGFALLSWPCSAASDLDRAYRIIAGRHVVDLTHSFGPTTPVGSGFGQANFTPAFDPKTRRPYTLKEDGFRTTYYDIVGQYGTHVDPPAHFAEDGVTMDKIPLKQMILEHCPVRAVISDRPA
jgi:Putative cyclase